ncbi:MAG: DNA mismatch repair protein MutS [Planctomycetes bacterium]|nr:DNA mismatch repair protein MutS [Planctomycetota bacterium]
MTEAAAGKAPSDDVLAGGRTSPMLQQYFGVKRQHPEALLFFRMGDFFELFFEDAKVASRVLGIALTSRSKEQDLPMAGVPVRTVDSYLRRLIQAGHTVVVCDQIEDPKQAKGLVERAVTRIVTPGTILEESLLESGRHNYLAALDLDSRVKPPIAALAWLDLSTGRFEAASFPAERIHDELDRIAPAELLLPLRFKERLPAELGFLAGRRDEGPVLAWRPDHDFAQDLGQRALCEQWNVGDLAGFGLEQGDPIVGPAAALLAYARETQRGAIDHVSRLRRRVDEGAMRLDRAAVQALELFETTRERRREGSLLAVVDRTKTAAGARLLRDWLAAPLTDPHAIAARHDAVGELAGDATAREPLRRESLRRELEGIFDLERIVARLAANRGSPRDLAQLRDTLRRLPAVRAGTDGAAAALLQSLGVRLVAPADLLALLERAIDEAPPLATKDGGFIRNGFHAELDLLRKLRFDVQSILADLQRREIERTQIPSLKVGFNSVFGYYLEITHAQRDRVPADYIRKQTLKNAERYITPELKELETRVFSAEERSVRLEFELFEQVRSDAARSIRPLQELAAALAELDCLQGFAEAAREHNYIRPLVDDSRGLEIDEGRHPVLAATLPPGSFVANDTRLGVDRACFALITGPNMAGKSTWLRQNALIVLLAQAGSFVPARRARVGAVDRIFTRVGASDDLSRGASTFMVEMAETANVLHHATDRSLVILDEVGRGTGTFDGMSLARALCEHLAEKVRCRTFFATHYHQLTQLAEELPSVVNLSVAVREWGDEILFLHRIVAGGTDRSYGLHVARLAGLPTSVIDRAKLLLADLERLTPEVERRTKLAVAEGASGSVPIADDRAADRVARELRRLDVDRLTPLQAITRLAELKQIAQGETPATTSKTARAAQGGPSLFGESGSV